MTGNQIFKRIIIAIFVVVMQLHTYNVFSQDDEPYQAPGKFYLTSDFGIILGSSIRLEVGPAVGYQITERWSAGIGGRYEFYRTINTITREEILRTDIFGVKVLFSN